MIILVRQNINHSKNNDNCDHVAIGFEKADKRVHSRLPFDKAVSAGAFEALPVCRLAFPGLPPGFPDLRERPGLT